MLIIAFLFAIIAIICFFSYRSNQAKLSEILYVPASRIGEITERASAVSDVLGHGYSSDYTEIKGEMLAPDRLRAPLSQEECVYYRSTVSRQWEEEENYRDEEGHQQTRTKSGSDTIFFEEKGIPFQVDDGSGCLWVDPENSEIDLTNCFDQTAPEDAVRLTHNQLRFKNLRLPTTAASLGRKRWVTGYHFQENIFEPEGQLYLLGTVVDHDGQLTLVHPSEKGQRYVISHKTEEELVADLESTNTWLFWGSVACGILAVLSAGMGLATGSTGF
jgi:hypothetical protein